jgi:cytochrome c-type biogenesis protein CcmE
MKKVNLLLLVGIAAFSMAGMTVLFLGSMKKNSGRYSTFELAKKSGSEVHIQGKWVRREDVVEDANYFEFYLQDSAGGTAKVHYTDPRPSNMNQAETVLIKGKYSNDLFVADKMYLKCPSKYEATEIPAALK